MMLVCIPFIVNGFDLYELIVEPSTADPEIRQALILSGNATGESQLRNFAIFGAVVTLGLCVLSLVLAGGLLRRRQSFQVAAALTFTILGLIALGSSASGLTSDPPAENAKIGLLVGLMDVGIVICLLMPSTQDDIQHAEWVRARRKHLKEDARAAKKAVPG